MKANILLVVVTSLLLVSCGAGSIGVLGGEDGSTAIFTKSHDIESEVAFRMPLMTDTIYSADIHLEKRNLSSALDDLVFALTQMGGEAENMNTSDYSVSLNGSVPLEKKEEWIEFVSSYGEIISLNQSGDNQSGEKEDLLPRKKLLEMMLEKYQTYLNEAEEMDDMIQIEEKINQYLSELSYYENRMQEMEREEASFQFTLMITIPDTLFSRWQLKEKLAGIGEFVVGFLAICLTVSLYLVVGLLVLIPFLAFFYWFLWGRIGLLKKIFIKLK